MRWWSGSRSSFVTTAVILLGASCLGPAPIRAALAPQNADQTQRLRTLEQQVEELRKELEASRASATLAAGRIAELERRIDLLVREIEKLRIGEAAEKAPLESVHGLGPAASKVYRKNKGVSIGGYGEALYQRFATRRDDGTLSSSRDTADLLRSVFYFGYKWTDRILFDSEVEFEHASTGEGAEERGEASVEFAHVDFFLLPEGNARAGLLLVPLGWVNELHEPPVFLGARRPGVEDAIIPTTWREIGAGGFGDWGSVSYRGYLVAGLDASRFSSEGIREGRQEGSRSKAEDLALTGRLDWAIRPGATLGGGFFTGDSGQGMRDSRARRLRVRTSLLESHAEWNWRGWQLRGLYARTSIGDAERLNDALGLSGDQAIGSRQSGWYGQAGFDLLSLFGGGSGGSSGSPGPSGQGERQALVLFVRYEAYDTQRAVPAGFSRDPQNDVRAKTAGVSWKPIPMVVIKADYQDLDNRAGTGADQVNLALGFIF